MRNIFILLVCLCATVAACSKKRIGEDEYTQLYYRQTQCADPWGIGSTDSLTLVYLSQYLNGQGLYIAGLNIKNDSQAELCQACACKTGKTIYVTTLNSDSLMARYIRIGFRQ